MKTRYYSTHRPITVGGYPKSEKVVEIHNFDNRTYCEEISREAWGWIEYERELPTADAENYELIFAKPEHETYVALRERQQKEVNDFPLGFAFSDSQFEEMMKEWGLKPTDTDKIARIGGGGFVRKCDSEELHRLFDRHSKELQGEIDADEEGTGFVKEMFLYEMYNHEYGYTGDPEDTLMALGLTAEDINNDPKLNAGFCAAHTEVFADD